MSGTADNSLYAIHQDDWGDEPEKEIEQSCQFLKNHLNGLGFIEDPIYDFPNSLTSNEYEGFHKLLLHLSPSYDRMDKNRANPSKKIPLSEAIVMNHAYLSEVIKTLKSEGAFLSEIRPEFLMGESEYREIITMGAETPRILANYKFPESEDFSILRSKAWIILIYQIFKVYSKVSVKKKAN